MKKGLLLIVMICSTLIGCQTNSIYSEYQAIAEDGWHADSVLQYRWTVEETNAAYEVLLTLRHTTQYPYQNLWLFVDEYKGHMLLHRDTIEAMMADDYGRWLGKGIKRYELPLQYDTQRRFFHSGEYTFRIQQGMRTEWLQGITDVGLVIRE